MQLESKSAKGKPNPDSPPLASHLNYLYRRLPLARSILDQHVDSRDAGCGISKHVFLAANTSSTMEVFCVESRYSGCGIWTSGARLLLLIHRILVDVELLIISDLTTSS